MEEKKKSIYYLKCKEGWGIDDYMNENGNKRGRIWKTKMRASAVPLKAIMAMEHRAASDVCVMCGQGAAEDQRHFMLHCDAYEEERYEMYERIEEAIGAVEWREVNGIEDLDTWLLRDMKCDSIVRNYLDTAFTKRKLYFH